MTTEISISSGDQQMTITHNNDVILKLAHPHEKCKTLPILTCDVTQLLNWMAFLFLNEISGEDFIQGMSRHPGNCFLCYSCDKAKLTGTENEMRSYCDSPTCIRVRKHGK